MENVECLNQIVIQKWRSLLTTVQIWKCSLSDGYREGQIANDKKNSKRFVPFAEGYSMALI